MMYPKLTASEARYLVRQHQAYYEGTHLKTADAVYDLNPATGGYPYSDTSRTYAPNTRIYGYIKGRFPSSPVTAKPRFYVGKFGHRTKVTL